MRKRLIASLFVITFAPACHGLIEVGSGDPGTSGNEGGTGGAIGGTKTVTNDGGSDSFTGTGPGGGGAATTDTGTGSDTGTSTGTDTGTSTGTDTGTSTNTACVPDPSLWPTGSVITAQTFDTGISVWTVAVDPSGNPIIAGQFWGQVTLGGVVLGQVGNNGSGFSDTFVAKLDPCGQVLWAKAYGTPGEDAMHAISVNANGDVFLLDSQFSNAPTVLLVKMDSAGQEVWKKTAKNIAMNGPRSLAATPDGGAVIVGAIPGPFDIGLGTVPAQDNDVLAVRFDANGQPVWQSWAGFPNIVAAAAAAVSPQDDTFVVGTLQTSIAVTKLNPSGQAAWHYSTTGNGAFDYPTLGTDAAGDVVVGGRYWLSPSFGVPTPNLNNKLAGFVLKLSAANGSLSWLDTFIPTVDPASQIWDHKVTVAPDGSVQLAGNYHGDFDLSGQGVCLPSSVPVQIYSMRLGPSGALQWVTTTGGNLMGSYATEAALAPDGRMWVIEALFGSVTLADGTVFDNGPNGKMTLLQMAP